MWHTDKILTNANYRQVCEMLAQWLSELCAKKFKNLHTELGNYAHRSIYVVVHLSVICL